MWKDVPKWEGKYAINEKGEVKNLKTGKLLTGDINNAGYFRVCLYDKPNKKKFFRHRLVAELFLENPNNLSEVNHIDGDKSNNMVENLEWSSRTHNEHECRRLGLKEYRPYQVIYINGSIEQYEFAPQLAEKLGVSKRTILNYLQNKSFGYKNFGIKEIKYI